MAPSASMNPTKKRKAEEFVYTVYSDDEEPPAKKGKPDDSDNFDEDEDEAFDSDFQWDDAAVFPHVDEVDGWDFKDAKRAITNTTDTVDLNKIIKDKAIKNSNARSADLEDVNINLDDEDDEVLADDAFGMGIDDLQNEVDVDNVDDEASAEDSDEGDDDSVATPEPHPEDLDQSSDDEEEQEDPEEVAKQNAFYAPAEKLKKGQGAANSFLNMNLSRHILRGITAAGYTKPTPVQGKTIPMALNGKDIVGSAATGSGKTAAFLIPILERLLYRDTRSPRTRVVVLTPTRELAMQCHDVATKLSTHTNIRFCLAVGGLSMKVQEAELRLRPDVVIATPGRFIDHMRNSLGFAVDGIEIMVLDEADRMLEDGFADELEEILKTLPKSRQTMLFSATMTSSVDKLVSTGLRKPHRIMVDSQKQTVGTLVQQFIKLRPRHEDKRMGYLVYLCKMRYTNRTIVFFKEKKQAHLTRIIFGLLGMSCAELHGAMKQPQRIASVEAFRDGKVSFLLASDVAARGLDIKGVDTVINYEAPSSQDVYLHRVGRTARAGRKGVACTIYTQAERKIMKAVVKEGKASRGKMEVPVIDPDVAGEWQTRVDNLEETIGEVLEEEKVQKKLAQAEMEMTKADNMIKHEDEIKARPKKTWFQSERDKELAQEKDKARLKASRDPLEKMRNTLKNKTPTGKLSNKDRKKLDLKAMRLEKGTMAKKQLNAGGADFKKKQEAKKRAKAGGAMKVSKTGNKRR
ncbi:uncharacterized protein MKZ38_007404 [Zalerion maritima]|uniref:RNA helicase n=1 Tax=Zalerion maritima TaxID=339359 RepID=A0AAD5RIU8_9PEZI|nr:uncharacterized protein MKZ38_007404 [Zalerion maritima]